MLPWVSCTIADRSVFSLATALPGLPRQLPTHALFRCGSHHFVKVLLPSWQHPVFSACPLNLNNSLKLQGRTPVHLPSTCLPNSEATFADGVDQHSFRSLLPPSLISHVARSTCFDRVARAIHSNVFLGLGCYLSNTALATGRMNSRHGDAALNVRSICMYTYIVHNICIDLSLYESIFMYRYGCIYIYIYIYVYTHRYEHRTRDEASLCARPAREAAPPDESAVGEVTADSSARSRGCAARPLWVNKCP